MAISVSKEIVELLSVALRSAFDVAYAPSTLSENLYINFGENSRK